MGSTECKGAANLSRIEVVCFARIRGRKRGGNIKSSNKESGKQIYSNTDYNSNFTIICIEVTYLYHQNKN